MKEDIAKLVINLLMKDDVLKVLVCLVRIDTFEGDKDLRNKYSLLKGVQTTDFGIDAYLSLNDPQVFFKELFKKHGLTSRTSEAADAISASQMNTTVQQELNGVNTSDIGNVSFKQYITENAELIQ
jgi:hypothetical protein